MTVYVWRDGRFVGKYTGEPMLTDEQRQGPVCCPMVQSDIPAYQSPIDGRWITSRSERREDLKRNGCIEIDPPKKKRGYRNPKFAAKRGLPLNEEARDTLNNR